MTIIHIDDKNFESEVKNSKTPVVIDFWAPWCGPCNMMGPVFEKLSSQYSTKLKFVKLDTDEHPELAERFSIQGIPTLIVLKDLKEIDRIVGFNSEGALKQKLDGILTKIK